MNMKKAIAGIFAGAVAISAVATTMASAKTVSQAAVDKTISFVNKQYKVSWATKVEGAIAAGASNTGNGTLTFTIKNYETNTAVPFDFNKVDISNVKLTLTGTSSSSTAQVEKSTELKKVSDGVYQVTLLGTGVTSSVDYSIPLSAFTLDATHGVYASLTYTVKDKSKAYTTLAKAKSGDSDVVIEATNENSTLASVVSIASTPSPLVDAGVASGILTGFASNFVSTVATFADEGANGFSMSAGTTYELDTISNSVLGQTGLTNMVANYLGGTKGAELTFNFKAPSASNDETDSFSVETPAINFNTPSSDDFGIMINNSGKLVKTGVKKDNSITFKWDDIDSNSSLFVNSAGLITSIKVKSASAATLESISIKVPAMSYDNLSAGESVADTTAAITSATAATTTAAATEATTTAAASNPKTGNAPVALAVIPVAIAAAAIIAKKRG